MLVSRILRAPEESFFVWGCRGTGKSTWLGQSFPGVRKVDLLDEALYLRFLANPSLFSAELRTVAPGTWVVVDEIQRLPALLNEVHRAIEERGLRFVLCGSSARKLKRAGVNLLGGRALLRHMHPFVPEELGSAFDVESAMEHGTLPLVWMARDRRERLDAYVQVYLKEEIQAEAVVRNLPGFVRFLPVAALLHGQALNLSNIAREAGVARTTVTGYLDILEETLIAFRVPAFEGRLRVRERRLPKLYFTDPGIARAARRQTGEVHSEERGALFEGLVAQYLRAAIDYYGLCDEMYYWASGGSRLTEVDFLLRKGDTFVAIEAKSGATFHDAWCKGLVAVRELAGLVRRMIVCPSGPASITQDGIEVVPFDRLVESVRWGTLFPG